MIMKEISLHLLDIAQNSISAGATLVEITVEVDHAWDMMRCQVKDNGRGMERDLLEKVTDPFTTTRTTRKVGLGIPFFKEGAEGCGGAFELESQPGAGTRIAATYRISHIDRPPLGDMADTIYGLVCCNDGIDFVYHYGVDGRAFEFDTRDVKQALGGDIPLSTPEVAAWIRECLNEGTSELNGGV